jgi:hypothetical protein
MAHHKITESLLRQFIVEEIQSLVEKTDNAINSKTVNALKTFAQNTGQDASALFKAITHFNVKSTLPTQSTKSSSEITKKDEKQPTSSSSSSTTTSTQPTQPTKSATKSEEDISKVAGLLSKDDLTKLATIPLSFAAAETTGNDSLSNELTKLTRLTKQNLQKHHGDMKKNIDQK